MVWSPTAIPVPVLAVFEVVLGAVGVVDGVDKDADVGVVDSVPVGVAESVVELSAPVIVEPTIGGLGGLVTDAVLDEGGVALDAVVVLGGFAGGAEMRVMEKAGLVLPESPNTAWIYHV